MPIGKAAAILINLAIVAGGMALQYVLTPKQKGLATDQGKLDDIRITGSEYGSLIPRVWGKARMGSNLVWSSGIRHEVSQTTTGGGGKKSPPAQTTTTHTYLVDMGLQICRGPIGSFGRTWADSDLIADSSQIAGMFEAESATLSGATILSNPVTYPDVVNASQSAYVRYTTDTGYIEFPTTTFSSMNFPTGEDPTTYQARSSLYISYKCSGTVKVKVDIWGGLAGTASLYSQEHTLTTTTNEWNVLSIEVVNATLYATRIRLTKVSGTTAPDIDKITLMRLWEGNDASSVIYSPSTGYKDPYAALDDTSLNPAKYYAYVPPYSADGKGTGEIIVSNVFSKYLGQSNQPRDNAFKDWLDTKYGTGNGINYATAYRDTVMAVFEDYNLRGGRIPNFTFEIIESTVYLKDVYEDIFLDCGLVAGDYDLTALNGIEITGIIEPSRQSKKAFLENLGIYYGFRMYESDGKIKFVLDDDFVSDGTISTDILRARTEGAEMKPYDAEVLISPKSELPREVRFNIMNPLLDYHNETITASLFSDMSSSDSQDFNFPIVDYPDNARYQAEKCLLKMYAEGKTITFSAMPEILQYSLGDIVTVTINGIQMKVRIEKMTIGMPIGVVEVEARGIEEYDPTEIFTTVTEQSTTTQLMKPKVVNLRNAKVIPIISTPIRGVDRGRLGCYLPVTPIGSGSTDAIALLRELGTDNYVMLDMVDVPPSCGVTDGTLGNHKDYLTKDTTNTLDIYFYNVVSLESFSTADLKRFPTLNLIRVGNEWIQFETAVTQSLPAGSDYRSKWRISNLWRGRFDTENKMTYHAASEDCVLWDDNVRFYDLTEGDINQTVTLKVTTGGQLVEDAKEFNFTFRPLSKYTVFNNTPTRMLDADSTSLNEVADVVTTVIKDLKL